MEDLIQEIKNLILSEFKQESNIDDAILMTTAEVKKMVSGIIPQEPFGEHEIFEVMKELGFKKQLTPRYSIDLNGNRNLVGYIFRWSLFPKERFY